MLIRLVKQAQVYYDVASMRRAETGLYTPKRGQVQQQLSRRTKQNYRVFQN